MHTIDPHTASCFLARRNVPEDFEGSRQRAVCLISSKILEFRYNFIGLLTPWVIPSDSRNRAT